MVTQLILERKKYFKRMVVLELFATIWDAILPHGGFVREAQKWGKIFARALFLR